MQKDDVARIAAGLDSFEREWLPGSNAKIERVLELITGKSRNYTKKNRDDQ